MDDDARLSKRTRGDGDSSPQTQALVMEQILQLLKDSEQRQQEGEKRHEDERRRHENERRRQDAAHQQQIEFMQKQLAAMNQQHQEHERKQNQRHRLVEIDLRRQVEQLKLFNQRLQQRTELMSRLTSTFSATWASYRRVAEKAQTLEALGLSEMTDTSRLAMHAAWNMMLAELPFNDDGSNERLHIHPFMATLIGYIFKCAGLENSIRLHREEPMIGSSSSPRIPDACISEVNIDEPTFETSLALFEFKALSQALVIEGQGQAVSYFTDMLLSTTANMEGADDFSAFIKSKALHRRFGIFSNREVIRFVTISENAVERYSDRLTLVPADVTSGSAPSKGFEFLFQVICKVAQDVSTRYEVIGNSRYPVISVYRTGLINVLAIRVAQQSLVVKRAKDPAKQYGRFASLERERRVYAELARTAIPGFNILRIHHDLSSLEEARLVFDRWGTALTTLFPKDESLLFDAIRFSIEQLRLFHFAGWVHNDLRAANILVKVVRDTPEVCLIDFETASHGDRLRPLLGPPATFLSDSRLRGTVNTIDNVESYVPRPSDDLCSFAYSVMFTIFPDLSQKTSAVDLEDVEAFIDNREQVIHGGLASENCPLIFKRALQMLKLLQGFGAADLLDHHYDELKSCFSLDSL